MILPWSNRTAACTDASKDHLKPSHSFRVFVLIICVNVNQATVSNGAYQIKNPTHWLTNEKWCDVPFCATDIKLQWQTLGYTWSTPSTTLQKQDKKDIPSHTYRQFTATHPPGKKAIQIFAVRSWLRFSPAQNISEALEPEREVMTAASPTHGRLSSGRTQRKCLLAKTSQRKPLTHMQKWRVHGMWKQLNPYTTTKYAQLQFYWVHSAQTNAVTKAFLSGFMVFLKQRDCAAVKFHNISLIATRLKHLFQSLLQ